MPSKTIVLPELGKKPNDFSDYFVSQRITREVRSPSDERWISHVTVNILDSEGNLHAQRSFEHEWSPATIAAWLNFMVTNELPTIKKATGL